MIAVFIKPCSHSFPKCTVVIPGQYCRLQYWFCDPVIRLNLLRPRRLRTPVPQESEHVDHSLQESIEPSEIFSAI